jgi:hypothetical protein
MNNTCELLQVFIATAEAPEKCVPALERIWPDLRPGVSVTVLAGAAEAAAGDLARRFPGLHVRLHLGDSVWHLRRRIGELVSTSKWMVVMEDHNLPQSGWLPHLMAEVENADARVHAIFGATCNQTSIGLWDWANYLAVLVFHWAPLQSNTVYPLLFNAAVRVAHLPAAPWTLGALEHAFARLAACGQMSGNFVVDHIQYRAFPSVLGYHFANGRATGATLRTQSAQPVRQLAGHVLHLLVVRPWRSLRLIHKHALRHQLPRGTWRRLLALHLAHACGAVAGFVAGPGQSMWQLE